MANVLESRDDLSSKLMNLRNQSVLDSVGASSDFIDSDHMRLLQDAALDLIDQKNESVIIPNTRR